MNIIEKIENNSLVLYFKELTNNYQHFSNNVEITLVGEINSETAQYVEKITNCGKARIISEDHYQELLDEVQRKKYLEGLE